MKTKTIILVILLILLLAVTVSAEPTPEKTEPLDRIPVTGCPYGDSIPMDVCFEYEPETKVPEIKQPATQISEPAVEVTEETSGK